MAIGDVSQKKFLHKALDTTPTNSQITNSATNKVTTITSITAKLQNSGVTKRTVTVYIYGTTASDELFSFDLDPTGIKGQIFNQLDYVLSGTETMSFKIDAGADVNINVMGTEEVVS